MKVGDTVPNQTMQAYVTGHKLKAFPGVCVYIHPDRTYYTLEFNLPGGKVRENYQFKYRRGKDA